MWAQIGAIARAQFRIARNHLPRTSAGTILGWMVLFLWYGLFLLAALFIAQTLAHATRVELESWLAPGFLGVFLFWQTVPLFTLSGGWTLELKKLQIYPVPRRALFGIETLLRITSTSEMIIVLAGATIGFVLRGGPAAALLAIALFILFNLFLQLAIRDLLLHAFEKSRLREVYALLLIAIAVVPQLIFRSAAGERVYPYFLRLARGGFSPWGAAASSSAGSPDARHLVTLLCWIFASFALAYWAFTKSLSSDDTFQSASSLAARNSRRALTPADYVHRIFRDPMAALIEKEIRSLIRMPRFRVVFAMACLLGMLVFFTTSGGSEGAYPRFLKNNLFAGLNLYGLLLLSETLLLNVFGLDRAVAQLYFAAPVEFSNVLKAKNWTAVFFIALQNLVVFIIAILFRAQITWEGAVSGMLISAVVTMFLLAFGNMTSVIAPRPIDPSEAFRKQSGAKMQLWIFAAALGFFMLAGFAFLTRYVLQSTVAFWAVLVLELAVGFGVYRLALDRAQQRGLRDREAILQALSKSTSPVGSG